jgi:hypothetical protein
MITTTRELIGSYAQDQSEFYPVAKISRENGKISLTFDPYRHLVIRNQELLNQYKSGNEHAPDLITREEFQRENNRDIPDNHRLVTVGTVLQVITDHDVYVPVLRRNGNVPETGALTYPSGLLSESPQSALPRETNEELGLVTDDKIIIVNPTHDRRLDETIQSYKRQAQNHNEILKTIFKKNANPFLKVEPTDIYSAHKEKVDFYGSFRSSAKYIVVDNPATHTINLISAQKIDLRGLGAVKFFDPEKHNRETMLLNVDDLETITSQKMTQALSGFVKKTALAFS